MGQFGVQRGVGTPHPTSRSVAHTNPEGPTRSAIQWARRERGDPVGEVHRVVLDPAEQRGTAGVQPGQAEEVHPRRRGDAAFVLEPAVAVEHGGCRSTVWSTAKPVAQVTARGHLRPGHADGPSAELDAMPAPPSARAGSDQVSRCCIRWPILDDVVLSIRLAASR